MVVWVRELLFWWFSCGDRKMRGDNAEMERVPFFPPDTSTLKLGKGKCHAYYEE